ncbi:MAG TPA: DUF4214 domain-containing protein [Bryobacteraceae bacterium]|nr:DUF4214 domain-containing protein [Bryobacteraceae bacterium]
MTVSLLFRTLKLVAIAVFASVGVLRAQSSLICSPAAVEPLVVRSEGYAELTSDILLLCGGGTAGETFTTNLTVSLNTGLTSKQLTNEFVDAMLLINEPGSTGGPTLAPGSNVILGRRSGTNAVTFSNVVLTAPGVAGNEFESALKLRIVNLRANAAAMVQPTPLNPPSVTATVSASNARVIVSRPPGTLAVAYPALVPTAIIPAQPLAFSQCASQNPTLPADPQAAFYIRAFESYQSAFRTDLDSSHSSTKPGDLYADESGFYNPQLGMANNLNTAGRATQPTRIMARFTGVPAGAALFVTTTPSPDITPQQFHAAARLVNTDSAGGGTATPVSPAAAVILSGASVGIAQVNLSGGSGSAVWEITSSNFSERDPLAFGVFLVYQSGNVQTGVANVSVGLAPQYSGPDQGTLVPRFAANRYVDAAFSILPCGSTGPDLTVLSINFPSGSTGGTATVGVNVYNSGGATASPSTLLLELENANGSSFSSTFQPLGPLAPGASQTVNVQIQTPLVAGTYQLTASTDVYQQVPERAEAPTGLTVPIALTNITPPPASSYRLLEPGQIVPATPPLSSLFLSTSNPNGTSIISENDWLTPELNGFFRAAPNTTSQARVGHLRANGLRYKVVQRPASAMDLCSTWTASPGSLRLPAAGGDGQLQLTPATSTCRWYTETDADWAQIFPLSGTGPVTLRYSVFPNFNTFERTTNVVGGPGADTEVVQEANALPYSERLVEQIYFNFLGRIPSQPERLLQAGEINRGVPPAELMARFYDTPEFNSISRFIAGLYVGLLGRDAELSGWHFQRNALLRNIVTQQSIVDNFLNSAEFTSKYGTLDNAGFIRLLYNQILLRQPSQAEVDFHAGTIVGGLSRVQVATNFLNSPEFRSGAGPRLTAFLLLGTVLGRDGLSSEVASLRNQISSGTPIRQILDNMVAQREFLATLD